MLELLTVLASAEGEESSKAAFYIAGSAFAVFAVLIGVVGMRGSFPSTDGAARAVMALSVVLALGAIATAAITG